MIAFNQACHASVTGRIEEAKERLQDAIKLDKNICALALDDEVSQTLTALERSPGAGPNQARILPKIAEAASRERNPSLMPFPRLSA